MRLLAVLVSMLVVAAASPAVAAPAWDVLPPIPTPRGEVAAAAVDADIWVVGGFSAGTDAVTGSRRVDVFDTTRGTWRSGPELPVPFHHTTLVAVGSRLVVVGGYTGRNVPTSLAWFLDTASAAPIWIPFAPLPVPRAAHTAVTDGERIWVFGGTTGAGPLPDESFVYEAGVWRPMADLPAPRDHLSGAYLDGRVYAIGGRVVSMESSTGMVNVFDPATDAWTVADDMPTPRGGLAAVVAGGRIVVAGGETVKGTTPAVEALDREGRWTTLPAMPTARHGVGIAAVDGAVHVLGGGQRSGLSFSAAHERLRLGGPEGI